MVFRDGTPGRVCGHNGSPRRLGQCQELLTGVRPLNTPPGKKERSLRSEKHLRCTTHASRLWFGTLQGNAHVHGLVMVRRIDLPRQHVLGEAQVNGSRTTVGRLTERLSHNLGHVFRGPALGIPFGDRPEQGDHVDLVPGVAAELAGIDVPADGHQRDRIFKRVA